MKFSFKHSMKWSIFISIVTFILACIFSVISTTILEGVGWGIGMLVVLLLVLIGIVFDMMGIASTAAVEKPFHAMASERVRGSKQAIQIVRNADRFSSFCNDVIGDIAGVISGAATAIVILNLLTSIGNSDNAIIYTVVSVIFAGVVSALTVGGKAMGKSIAIHFAEEFILLIGKFFYFLESRLGIHIFNGKKNKSSNGKRGNKRVV
jgi:CBS domain containing-hemolysin-like protein